MHIFTFSDEWGPFKCEVPGCTKEAWNVILSDDEYMTLPDTGGPAVANYILRNKLGTTVCKTCLKQTQH